jgi:DNA-binding NarL/FixJ family response regulator
VSEVVRLFIATHAVALRELLAQSLDDSEEFDVVGQCSSAAEALVRVPQSEPDLLLASRLLPDGTGADLVRSLRAAGSKVPALLLSNLVDVAVLEDAIDAGATGIEVIWINRQGLDDALRRAARNEIVAPADVLREMLDRRHDLNGDPLGPLSGQEREVFDLVGQGLSNPEIADQLHLAQGTVRNYVSRVLGKVGMQRRAQVITYVAQHGSDPSSDQSITTWQ